jgi:CBS domain-containing protein
MESKQGGIAMAVTPARTVREAMHDGCECIGENQTLLDAAKRMEERDIGAMPICGEDDRLKGMLTDRDIVVKALARGKDPATTRCGEFAQGNTVWIRAEASLEDALNRMRERAVKRMPVLDENKRLCGIVTEADIATHSPGQKTGEFVEAIASAPPQHF